MSSDFQPGDRVCHVDDPWTYGVYLGTKADGYLRVRWLGDEQVYHYNHRLHCIRPARDRNA